VVAAIFEAQMTADQVESLVALMQQHRDTRPQEVVLAALHVDGSEVALVAYWRSRAALEAYLATGETPRGTALMLEVGVASAMRVVDVPQYA
jgi:hypothetical protein